MSAVVHWLSENAALTTMMLVVSVVVLICSLWLCYYALVSIPPDYFNRRHQPLERWRSRPVLRWTLLVAKNFVGALLVIMGLVMFFAPGQGILTLLLGISLMDVPGKQKLERKIVERPAVLKAINKLRARANKPPLDLS